MKGEDSDKEISLDEMISFIIDELKQKNLVSYDENAQEEFLMIFKDANVILDKRNNLNLGQFCSEDLHSLD